MRQGKPVLEKGKGCGAGTMTWGGAFQRSHYAYPIVLVRSLEHAWYVIPTLVCAPITLAFVTMSNATGLNGVTCEWFASCPRRVCSADSAAPQTPTGIQVIQVSDFYQRAGILQYVPLIARLTRRS